MTEQDRALTKASIMRHEGFSPRPVPDTGGTIVLGYGMNFSRWPMTEAEAQFLLDRRLDQRINDVARAWPPFAACDGPRQRALAEMGYQLGADGLLLFPKMLHAIVQKDYEGARLEVLNSTLAKQTPGRALDYAALLRETE